MDNICKFIRTENSAEINILNFVYEKKAIFPQKFTIPATYSLHAVTSGVGKLHTTIKTHEIKKGDLFFTFAAKAYYIENSDNLQYIYINFSGSRAEALLDRVGAKFTSPVFPEKDHICQRWETYFDKTSEEGLDLAAEGLLLCTLSSLCRSSYEKPKKDVENGILKIKAYTDLNFTDPKLNLKSISQKFAYDPKYVSTAFPRFAKQNYTKYLRTLRLEHSKRLFESGMISIKEVANLSGYTDALYFSKIFKEYCNIPPREYIKSLRRDKKGI